MKSEILVRNTSQSIGSTVTFRVLPRIFNFRTDSQ